MDDGSGVKITDSVMLEKLADPPARASRVIVVSSPTVPTGEKDSVSSRTATIPLSDTVLVTVEEVGHTEPIKAAPRHSSLVIVSNAGGVTGSNNIRSHA